MARTQAKNSQLMEVGQARTVAQIRAEAAASDVVVHQNQQQMLSPRDRARERARAKMREDALRRIRANELDLATNSASLVEANLELPANSLVHKYQVKVIADRGQLALARDVADLRETTHNGQNAIVIDFGRMMTVDALFLPSTSPEHLLYPWLGASFASEPHGAAANGSLGPHNGNESRPSDEDIQYVLYRYRFTELRSEKLLLVLKSGDVSEFIEQLELSLPQLPADLQLRIDNGPPIWTAPGPVELGTSATLDDRGWTESGERLVDITEAIAPLVGDANNNEIVRLPLSLSSTVPGRLGLVNVAADLQLMHRLSFNGEQRLTVQFDDEGQAQLGLPTTDANGLPLENITGLRLTLEADQAPERVLPAIGPAISDKAELVLGKGRAACLRLDGAERLEQLSAVRLPLRAGGNRPATATSSAAVSAEAKVILWTSQNGAPLEPLETGISTPVSFDGAKEQWLTFEFEEPVPVDPAAPLWAAVVVNRGEVAWRLAAETDVYTPRLVRIGAPDGPWRALPSGFGVGQSLGQASARARVVGLAAETRPIAPLQLQFEGGSVLELSPGVEPVQVEISVPEQAWISAQAAVAADGDEGDGALGEGQLLAAASQDGSTFLAGTFITLTSHARGVVTLSDVDAITEFSNVAS